MMPLKSTVTKPPKTLATKQAVTNIKDLLDFGLLFVFAFFFAYTKPNKAIVRNRRKRRCISQTRLYNLAVAFFLSLVEKAMLLPYEVTLKASQIKD